MIKPAIPDLASQSMVVPATMPRPGKPESTPFADMVRSQREKIAPSRKSEAQPRHEKPKAANQPLERPVPNDAQAREDQPATAVECEAASDGSRGESEPEVTRDEAITSDSCGEGVGNAGVQECETDSGDASEVSSEAVTECEGDAEQAASANDVELALSRGTEPGLAPSLLAAEQTIGASKPGRLRSAAVRQGIPVAQPGETISTQNQPGFPQASADSLRVSTTSSAGFASTGNDAIESETGRMPEPAPTSGAEPRHDSAAAQTPTAQNVLRARDADTSTTATHRESAPQHAVETPDQPEPTPPADRTVSVFKVSELRVGDAHGLRQSAQQSPAPTDSDQFEAQLARGMAAALQQKGGTVTLRMQPETLGQLRIHMDLSPGQVALRFQVADAQARDLLESSLQHLRASLEAKGLAVEKVAVHIDPTLAKPNSDSDQRSDKHPGDPGSNPRGGADAFPGDSGSGARQNAPQDAGQSEYRGQAGRRPPPDAEPSAGTVLLSANEGGVLDAVTLRLNTVA